MQIISVIIPFYREIDLIRRAVKSVCVQDLESEYELEILIVNDGNYDNSNILHQVADLSPCVHVLLNDSGLNGAGPARNVGIDASRGEILCFLDADDYWLPGKLQAQLKHIKDFNFIPCCYILNDKKVLPPAAINDAYHLLCNSNIGTSSVMLKKELLGECRFSSREFSQDTELWGRLADKPNFLFMSVSIPFVVYEPSDRTKNKLIQLLNFIKLVNSFDFALLKKCTIIVKYSSNGLLRHYL